MKSEERGNTNFKDLICSSLVIVIVTCILIEIIAFIFDIFHWLKSGFWKSVRITDYFSFDYLQNNWLGVYKIIETPIIQLNPIVSILLVFVLLRILEK